MTFKYNDVYVKDTATIAGPYEKKGPLKKYFDKTFDDIDRGCRGFLRYLKEEGKI